MDPLLNACNGTSLAISSNGSVFHCKIFAIRLTSPAFAPPNEYHTPHTVPCRRGGGGGRRYGTHAGFTAVMDRDYFNQPATADNNIDDGAYAASCTYGSWISRTNSATHVFLLYLTRKKNMLFGKDEKSSC